jgi:hypothetical protein
LVEPFGLPRGFLVSIITFVHNREVAFIHYRIDLFVEQ